MHIPTALFEPDGRWLKRALRTLLTIAMVLSSPGFVLVAAQDLKTAPVPVYGPRICLDARFWNTPGWQPRGGDYAYIQVTPGRTASPEIRRALGDIPAASRMLRSGTMAGMENVLHQLIEVEGFKLV